jgi:hypothetical protein
MEELLIPETDLRRVLHELTECGDVTGHQAALKELRTRIPHTIEVLTTDPAELPCNCIMYALHLERDSEYWELGRFCLDIDPESYRLTYQGVHADTTFLKFLIEQKSIELSSAGHGAMAIYFEGESVRHAGRMTSHNRVTSKWGCNHLHAHGLGEVPSTYGDRVRFYRPHKDGLVIDEFVRYAIHRGLSAEALSEFRQFQRSRRLRKE